jgi:hypothetical protein
LVERACVVLSGNATPEQLQQAADSLGVSVAARQQIVAQRRNPAMAPQTRITVAGSLESEASHERQQCASIVGVQ